jgi:hypothetical protein
MMVWSIIVMNKPYKNIVIKLKRGLLNQTSYCNRATELKKTNTKQARMGTNYYAIMVLNYKISDMVAPDSLISSGRSRLNNSNTEITMSSCGGSSGSVKRSWQSGWSPINDLETMRHPASRI